jgi:hypothetical protein
MKGFTMVSANTPKLCLHAGGTECSLEQLRKVKTPKPQDHWVPIPHDLLVKQVKTTLGKSGLQVVHEQHATSHEGMRYFGILQLLPEKKSKQNKEYGLITGLRNSHDKIFSASMSAGAGVFVCDNLSFSGEVVLARKHTLNILRDLPGLVERMVGRLNGLHINQETRFKEYKKYELTDAQVHDIVIHSMDLGIMGSVAIPRVLKSWRTPEQETFAKMDKTCWRLFNAYTDAFKDYDVRSLADRTIKLHGQLDSMVGLTTKDLALPEDAEWNNGRN